VVPLAKTTKSLLVNLYPKINTLMGKNLNKYKACIGRFFDSRSKEMMETSPLDRIFFGLEDENDFYNSIGISEAEILPALQGVYYWDIANFNPRCAKHSCTVAMLSVIRYFHIKKMQKELEMSMIHLAFSGKFYPSIHYSSFPTVCPRDYEYIMLGVVNTKLSNKYDLKIHGSNMAAIRSICLTWVDSYSDKLKNFDDEDIVYILQQLHSRIKSFMQNIAELYYEAYKNKDTYMTYDSDSLDDSNYHLADNDSLKAERVVEKTMETINSSSVDYKLCKMSSDSNIKTEEIKSIIETITSDPKSSTEVKELVRLMTVTYFEQSGNNKDVRDISFITFSIASKPNTKDKNILRQRELIESWLSENSESYRKRRSRLATRNSYNRAILMYFTLMIHNANK